MVTMASADREVERIEIGADLGVLADLTHKHHGRNDEDEHDEVHDLGNDKRIEMQPFREGMLLIEEFEGPHEAYDPEHSQEDEILREERHHQRQRDDQVRNVREAQEEAPFVPLDVEARRDIECDDDGDENVDGEPHACRGPVPGVPGHDGMDEKQGDGDEVEYQHCPPEDGRPLPLARVEPEERAVEARPMLDHVRRPTASR
jgi:hypothetical protein